MHVPIQFLLLLLALLVPPVAAQEATCAQEGDETYTLTVLHTNDTHGRPLAFRYRGQTVGGLAARKTAIDHLSEGEENVLVVDAGDVCDGMPVSNMNGVEPDFAGMGLLGYDAMALGNHEFSHDLAHLLRLQKIAGFPFLCANLTRDSDGSHPFKPYVIVERGGRKIALLGLLPPETKRIVLAERLAGLSVADAVETLQRYVPRLREEADHVIVLSHCGLLHDSHIAESVPGIDLIVGGHSHSLIAKPLRSEDTVIVQAWRHGLVVGKVRLTFRGRKLETVEGGLVPINFRAKAGAGLLEAERFEEDPDVLARLAPYEKKVASLLKKVVGKVGPAREPRAGWLDFPFPNLAADAMRWASGADCALQNTGGVRTRLAPGEVTVNDVMTMLPFDNNVIVVKVTGEALHALLDHAIFVQEERPRAFAALSGLEVVVNARSDAILSVRVGDAPLDRAKVYRVAVNSFMFQGGDDFDFSQNSGNYDCGYTYAEALVRFLEEKKEVAPAADGRLRTVDAGGR